MMANFTFCLTLVFLLLGGGFPLGVDATTYRLNSTSLPQYFTSANYPSNYPQNTSDDWVIDSGSSDYRVHITVVDVSVPLHDNCTLGYFYFTDGHSPAATFIKRCGSWRNCAFQSSGRYATISLRTDRDTADKGFRMSYYRVLGTASKDWTSCTTGSTTITTSYSLTATSSPQYFTSANYPSNYPHYTNDDWVIDSGSSDYRVHITVVDSSIEYHSVCDHDYFSFTDGHSPAATFMKHCGSWSNCYFESSGRYATISLRTDGSAASRGFRMSYHRVPGSASIAVTSCTASGARPSASVPVGWKVGCTLVVLVSFGRVGWEGFYV